MKTKIEVQLTRDELEMIWKEARKNKNDMEGFITTFSNGLYKGIETIREDAYFVHDNNLHYELHLAARDGDYEKFTTLFEKNLIDVNDHYTGACEGETFLYTVTVNDSQHENQNIVVNRQKIARYLLEKGANMDKPSFDISGSDLPSPWTMFERHKKGYLNHFFTYSHLGQNIFPILQEFRNKETQNLVPLNLG
jgi:hypothetical protein